MANQLPGGFPCGRISHIYGPESSAKTVLMAEPLGSALRQGGRAICIDAECTFDFVRAGSVYGVDVDKLEYISPEDANLTIEYLFDNCFQTVEDEAAGEPICVGVDSLSAIPSGVEMAETLSEKSYGMSRAKSLSKGFRTHIWKLNQKNISLIFVDQTRQNVGVTFGKKYTFSGGEALKFYASTRIMVNKTGEIKNKNKLVVGITVGFKVEKNKVAPPGRSGKFRLLFDYGIDDIGTNLQWLKEMSGDSSYIVDGKKNRSLDDAIKQVESNNLEKVIEAQVYKVWQEVYAVPERKERIR